MVEPNNQPDFTTSGRGRDETNDGDHHAPKTCAITRTIVAKLEISKRHFRRFLRLHWVHHLTSSPLKSTHREQPREPQVQSTSQCIISEDKHKKAKKLYRSLQRSHSGSDFSLDCFRIISIPLKNPLLKNPNCQTLLYQARTQNSPRHCGHICVCLHRSTFG